MQITSEAIAGLFAGFKTIFNKAFAGKTPSWNKVATLVPSSAGDELYPWLGAMPRMREWIGDRIIKKLAAEGYRIRNKKWESTISVPVETIEDDQYGVFAPLIQMMGEEAATYPDQLVFDLLKDGFTNTCYDGKAFFAADHPGKGKSTQSNKGTAALSMDSYGAARAAMMSLTDEEGRPLKVMPDLLVVPPALEGAARKILMAETVGSDTNVYKGTAQLLVAPELAGKDTAWYLLATGKAIKPLIFQERKKPEFVQRTKSDSDPVFERGEYQYGTDARSNAGYSLWQLAYGSTGAGS